MCITNNNDNRDVLLIPKSCRNVSENEVETCLCPNSSTQLPSRYLYAPIEISSAMSLFHFETASGHGNSRGYHIGIIHTTWKFPVFGVIQSECGKIRISITLNTDTFYAVTDIKFLIVCGKLVNSIHEKITSFLRVSNIEFCNCKQIWLMDVGSIKNGLLRSNGYLNRF